MLLGCRHNLTWNLRLGSKELNPWELLSCSLTMGLWWPNSRDWRRAELMSGSWMSRRVRSFQSKSCLRKEQTILWNLIGTWCIWNWWLPLKAAAFLRIIWCRLLTWVVWPSYQGSPSDCTKAATLCFTSQLVVWSRVDSAIRTVKNSSCNSKRFCCSRFFAFRRLLYDQTEHSRDLPRFPSQRLQRYVSIFLQADSRI